MVDFGRIGIAEIIVLLFLAGATSVYFIPTILAASSKNAKTGAIAVVNLLFGWTLIGWIVAFIWACSTPMLDAQNTRQPVQAGPTAPGPTTKPKTIGPLIRFGAISVVVVFAAGGVLAVLTHSGFPSTRRTPALLDCGARGIRVSNDSDEDLSSCSVQLYGGYVAFVESFRRRESIYVNYSEFKIGATQMNESDGYVRARYSTTMICSDAQNRARHIALSAFHR